MNPNVRFYTLVVVVLSVVVGLFYVIRGNGKTEPVPSRPTASNSAIVESQQSIDAPAITSSRRDSSLIATASRPSAPREMKTAARVGVEAILGEVTLEEDNVPVEGADVVLMWKPLDVLSPAYDEESVWNATTNARGLFRVDKLPDGEYLIVAKKDNLTGVSGALIRPLLRETDGQVVQIGLRPSGSISGTVVDDKQQPIARALVVLGRGKSGQRDLYGGDLQTKSGQDGGFTLDYVRTGEWTLEAKADGYAAAEVTQVQTDGRPAQIVLKKGGSVSGAVVAGETSKPVPNVIVQVRGRGQLSSTEVTTDREGKFAVADLADGTYRFAVEKQPYLLSGQAPTVVIENASSVNDLQIVVAFGGSVSGRATDAVTGSPIANLGFRPYLEGRSRMNIEAGTDEDGYYRIEGLPAGRYNIRRMWMAGYRHGENREDKTVDVALGQEVTGIDFSVPPGLYLRGRVTDKNGEPLFNVSVQSADERNEEGETTQTDDKGRFVHRGFSPGTVIRISAEKAGYSAPPKENIAFPDHDMNDVEFVMDTGGSVAGIVVDKTGKPMPDLYVTAMPMDVPGAQTQQAYSREEGAFKVQGLMAGKYKLKVRAPQSYRERDTGGTEVKLTQGQEVTGIRLVADFDAGVKIAGRVVDTSNKPVRDASVNARMRTQNEFGGGPSSEGHARTDTEGAFEIAGLDTGTHELGVYHNEYSRYRDESVDAPSPNLTITLRGKGTIQGRVFDARSGQPVKTFNIVSVSGEVGVIAPGSTWGGGQTFVNDEGKYELRVGEDVKSLVVTSQGFAPKAQPVGDVREGQTRGGVDIRLDPGGVVTGTVTNKQGERIAGASIWMNQPPQQWDRAQRAASATTGADGAYRIDSLPPGDVRLFATHGEYATANGMASSTSGGTATVNFVLGAGGTISGAVRVNGTPSSGYGVSIHFPQQEGGGFNSRIEVDGSGVYTFKGLPEGEANVSVYGTRANIPNQTMRQMQKTATVVSDRVTTVDFDIVSGTASIEGVVTRDGQPPGETFVNVRIRVDAVNQEYAGTQADAQGAYRLEGLPVGTGTLSVHVREPNQSRSFQVELEDHKTARLDIEMSAGARAAGRVSGVPESWGSHATLFRGHVQVPDDFRAMWTTLGEFHAGNAQVNTDGTFEFAAIEEGDYTVVVTAFDPHGNGEIVKQASQAISVTEGGQNSVSLTIR